jgi:hypothetical protein
VAIPFANLFFYVMDIYVLSRAPAHLERTQMNDLNPSLVGATGVAHLSKPEAAVSFKLLPLGIVPDDSFFPVRFVDSQGKTFLARSDFRHEATGYIFEYKAGAFNGIKTTASADRQRADFESADRQGFIRPEHRLYRLNEVAWSNSLVKQAIVQKTLGPNKFGLLLRDEPDPETRDGRRLLRSGLFYRTERNISGFVFFLRLAAAGVDVGFAVPGHCFGVATAK